MTLNIAICDDDVHAVKDELEAVNSLLKDRHVRYSIQSAVSPKALLSSSKAYDIALLDIEMPDINGIALAKKLMERNKSCLILFVTSYPVYLDKAFDVKAFRFLTKPFDKERLSAGIESAVNKVIDSNRTITLTNKRTKQKINLEISSIIYLENVNRHTSVTTTKYEFIAAESYSETMKKIEAEVNFFIESAQSIFVNLKYVTDYDRMSVKLEHEDKSYMVNISRRKYRNFEQRLFDTAGKML